MGFIFWARRMAQSTSGVSFCSLGLFSGGQEPGPGGAPLRARPLLTMRPALGKATSLNLVLSPAEGVSNMACTHRVTVRLRR